MARGDACDEMGWIEQADHGLILRVQGGGWWRLDFGWRSERKARRLVGQRVRVMGVRDGFNTLAVRTIEA